MAVAHVNTQQNQNAGGASTLSVTKPTGLANGHVLIAACVINASGATLSLPTDFIELNTQLSLTTSATGYRWGYKVVTNAGSEPASYTFDFGGTSRKAAGFVAAYSGCDTAAPVAISTSYNGGTSTTFSGGSLATNFTPNFYLGVVAQSNSGSFSTVASNGPTVTERADTTSTGGGGGTTKVAITMYDSSNPRVSGGEISGFDFVTTATANDEAAVAYLNLKASGVSITGGATTLDGGSAITEIIVMDEYNWTAQADEVAHNESGLAIQEGIYLGVAQRPWPTGGFRGMGRAIFNSPSTSDDTWGDPTSPVLFAGSNGFTNVIVERLSSTKMAVGYTYGSYQGSNYCPFYIIEIMTYNPGSPPTVSFGTSRTQTQGDCQSGRRSMGRLSDTNYISCYYYVPTTTNETYIRIGGQAQQLLEGANFVSNSTPSIVTHVDDTTAVVAYTTNADFKMKVLSITNSGTTLTQETANVITRENANVDWEDGGAHHVMRKLTSTKGVLLHAYSYPSGGGNTRLTLRTYDISGTTITANTEYEITQANIPSEHVIDMEVVKPGVIAVIYTKSNAGTYSTYVRFFSISGDTFTPLNEDVPFYSAYGGSVKYYGVRLSKNGNNKVALTYRNLNTSTGALIRNFEAPPQIAPPQMAYIHVDPPADKQLLLNNNLGSVPLGGGIGAYSPTIQTITSSTSLFTQGHTLLNASAQSAYINGAAAPAQNYQPSYIAGFQAATSNTLAFIYNLAPIESFTQLYMSGADNITGSTDAYVTAPGIGLGSQPAYLAAPTTIDILGRQCYIEGANPFVFTNGQAIRFDKNQSQRLQFPDNVNIRPSTVTVNFWMRPTEAPDATRGAYLIKSYNGTDRTIGIFEGNPSGTQKWHYGVRTSSWNARDSVATYVLGRWYMITLTYDQTNVRLYVNGQLDSSLTHAGTLTWTAHNWYVAYRDDVDYYASFDFSDLTIYEEELDAAAITSLYHPPYIANGVLAWIEGGAYVPISDHQDAYVVSTINIGNPAQISSSLSLRIAHDAFVTTQRCYLVGGPRVEVSHDLEITLDDFREERFDLLFRVGVQGERAIERHLGNIQYPITRERRDALTNLFFFDMPGDIQEVQRMYIHSGWALDTVNGDLTGQHPESVPQVRRCYIPGPQFAQSRMQLWITGQFTPITAGVQRCFIPCNETTQMSFINGSPVTPITQRVFCWIKAPINEITSTVQNAYVKGGGLLSDSQRAYVHVNSWAQNRLQCFITAGSAGALNTNQDTGKKMFVRGSAVGFDDGQDAYIFGNYIGTDSQSCFVTAQPTIENSQLAFIKAPYAILHEVPQRLFVKGLENITDNQSCFIQATTSVIDNQVSYIKGRDIAEGSKAAYVVNNLILSITDSQRLFLQTAGQISASVGCVVNGGVISGVQTAFIMNLDFSDTAISFRRCYITGAGIAPTAQGCYIRGSLINATPQFAYVAGV